MVTSPFHVAPVIPVSLACSLPRTRRIFHPLPPFRRRQEGSCGRSQGHLLHGIHPRPEERLPHAPEMLRVVGDKEGHPGTSPLPFPPSLRPADVHDTTR